MGDGGKSEEDKVTPGFTGGKLGEGWHMGGSFMLFRGAPMEDDWVKPYAVKIGEVVRLPQSTSTTKDPVVALGFAIPDSINDNQTPTLFVIACQNYRFITGLTMNNEAYTAYPSEAEVLLCEGCRIHVLGVDYGVKIDNVEGQIADFNGHKITVVHLFHRM